MKTKYLIFVLFLAISIFSCSRKIDLTLPNQEQKIIINGILASDSTLFLSISKSISTTDTAQKLPRISNATCKLYENGIFLENLFYIDNGIYSSVNTLKENEKYTLDIVAEGKKFNIDIDIPKKNYLDQIKYENFNQANNYYKINIKLNDKIGKNFYILESYCFLPEIRYNEYINKDTVIYLKSHVYLSAINEQNPYFNYEVDLYPYFFSGLLFNDDFFDGESFETDFQINNSFYVDTSVTPIDSITIYFHLMTIDNSLYKFFVSYEKYQNSDDNPMVEPVNIFSNIEGGAGLLSGLSITLDSIKVPYIENFDIYY